MEEKILELIANKQYTKLKEEVAEMNPADLGVIFEEVPEKDLAVIFRILPKELAAEVFVELDSDIQQLLIEAFSDKELREVLDNANKSLQ